MPKTRSSTHNAVFVAAGILASRIIGLVRERIFAHYFGNSDAADAFKAALKIPNLLQNLFGEGALSASFIPVYSNLLSFDQRAEANRVARVVGSILALGMSILVLAGVLATPLLIDAIAPGFEGIKREYTIRMVRILFPGIGVLVLSAWCLGILNSHRRFFLPYAAPVLWNAAMIAVLLWFGGRRDPYPLAVLLAWGALAGSLLQFAVQIPSVLRLTGRFRFLLETASDNVRSIIRNFVPGVAGRGVNQLSSYIDQIIASFLPAGAVAALAYAQTLYLLPVSLFGMSVSNAELPEMSSGFDSAEASAKAIRDRLNAALRRVAFFIIPSAAAFLALGDSISAFIFQTGKFTRDDAVYVWAVLAGPALGLLAATLGRLYTSAFWALRDTRTPLHFAIARVVLSAALGWFLAFPVTAWLGISPRLGLVGLTVSAGVAAWLEFTLLRTFLNRRIGKTGLAMSFLAQIWFIAGVAALLGFLVKLWTRPWPPLVSGSLVVAVFGISYFGLSAATRIAEARQLLQLFRSKLRI